ncbi:hypothetical protein CRG98_034367 [Punica granatum]|uniref:Uncharacterized protein n=1 Tax=Punica granatum TaxID=22663 RepID=A0A2I0INI0_PUNGR|nr:hypothetical protein CRG98_034367 [Punica granatum]
MEGACFEDDERLIQMVQDFIESDSSSSLSSSANSNGSFFPSSSSDDHDGGHRSKYSALRDILERAETGAEAEVLASVMKLMRRRTRRKGLSCRDHASTSTALKKWLVIGLQMDGYLASLCQTSWVTSLGCPGGDYEYIDVLIPEGRNEREHSCRLIVDIDFKSQFEVARPTRTYEVLTDILPAVFVGTESKLNGVISILCSAAKQSLRDRGLHVPPWRTAVYMQSKWLSPVSCSRSLPGVATPPATYFVEDDNDSKAMKSKMMWAGRPPLPPSKGAVGVKGKRGELRNGSALSSQFSNMSINCC